MCSKVENVAIYVNMTEKLKLAKIKDEIFQTLHSLPQA